MDHYTTSSTNVNPQDEELTQANAFIVGWNAQFDPKPVKPMEHKPISQQSAQPALPTPAAEPASAPRPAQPQPQHRSLPTSFLEQSELSQVTFFYDYGARLYTMHPDEVHEQAWINAGCAMRAAQRRFLGIGDYRDECTVKTFLVRHILLPASKGKRKQWIELTGDNWQPLTPDGVTLVLHADGSISTPDKPPEPKKPKFSAADFQIPVLDTPHEQHESLCKWKMHDPNQPIGKRWRTRDCENYRACERTRGLLILRIKGQLLNLLKAHGALYILVGNPSGLTRDKYTCLWLADERRFTITTEPVEGSMEMDESLAYDQDFWNALLMNVPAKHNKSGTLLKFFDFAKVEGPEFDGTVVTSTDHKALNRLAEKIDKALPDGLKYTGDDADLQKQADERSNKVAEIVHGEEERLQAADPLNFVSPFRLKKQRNTLIVEKDLSNLEQNRLDKNSPASNDEHLTPEELEQICNRWGAE